MKTEVETTAYLVVQGDRLKYGRVDPETGLRPLDGARVVRALRNRPEGLTADQVAVRVRLVLTTAIFDPPAPVAVVRVPADLVQYPVEVTAQDVDADA